MSDYVVWTNPIPPVESHVSLFEERRSEVRVCGNDFVYCDGDCKNCPRLILTSVTASTDTDFVAERREK